MKTIFSRPVRKTLSLLLAALMFASCFGAFSTYEAAADDPLGVSVWDQGFSVTNDGNVFTISRTDTSTDATVRYRTVSLSALEGKHFTAKSGQITFDAGESSKNITVSEKSSASVPLRYRFQSDTSRTYRFEVLDMGGFRMCYVDRNISYASTYKYTDPYTNAGTIRKLVYFDNNNNSSVHSNTEKYYDLSHSGTSGTWLMIDDDYDYDNHTLCTVPLSGFYDHMISGQTGLAPYLEDIGDKLYATVYFKQKEEDDGYQYIQILADNTTTYDGKDPDGSVNTPSTSLYKAAFILTKTEDHQTTWYYQMFPHNSDSHSGSDDFDYTDSYLYKQAFKDYSANRASYSGSLVLSPNTGSLSMRFDANGSGADTWYLKDLKVRCALLDAVRPTRYESIVVSPGPYYPGNTFYISIPFSETVVVTGTPSLDTNWGSAYYITGSGTNVLTFSGTIPTNVSTGAALTVSKFFDPGTIADQVGNVYLRSSLNSTFSNATVASSYQYPITYDLAGGEMPSGTSNPSTYTYYTSAFTLNNPTRTGYTFAGWTGTGLSSPSTSVRIAKNSKGDRYYTATWTLDEYPITYNMNGGGYESGVSNPATYTYETGAFTLNNPSRTGYNFTGWTGTGLNNKMMTVTVPAHSTGTRNYSANWSTITYLISYDDNSGGNPVRYTGNKLYGYTVESDEITLSNPMRDYYDFTGWTGTDLTEPTVTVTIPTGSVGDRAYTANWTPIVYSISYDLAGGYYPASVTVPATYTYESPVVNLPSPMRDGYNFVGWNYAGAQQVYYNVTIPTGSHGDRSYTAVWSARFYPITYDLGGGSLPEGVTNPSCYTIEDSAITLNNPTRTGCTFAGWTGSDLTEPTLTVTIPTGSMGERSFKANWTKVDYAVTYDLAGGELPEGVTNPSTYDIETAFTLNNPVRPGYTFEGWTGTGLTEASTSVSVPTGETGERSYTALWSLNDFVISYDLASGSLPAGVSNPGGYSWESDTITLNNPVRNGYTFTGWTGTDLDVQTLVVTIPAHSTGDRSYTAHWSLDTYTITYDLAGGELAAGASNPATFTAESDAFTLNNPSRTGYTFAGWTGAGLTEPTLVLTIPTGSFGDRVYTAAWTPIIYTIDYDLGGGALPEGETNPTSYTIEDGAITLINPVRTGYAFVGWNGSDVILSTTVTIPAGSTGERGFTAVWTADFFTITWLDEDGSLIDTTAVPYDSLPTHADPAKPSDAQYNYTFAGWSPAVTTVTGNAAYTATYTAQTRSYTVLWNDLDGNVLRTDVYEYGQSPAYGGMLYDPDYGSDVSVEFFGWKSENGFYPAEEGLPPVTEDIGYTTCYIITGSWNGGTWTVDNVTGTLSIEGRGEMDDYLYTEAPWKSCWCPVSSVSIGDGVTSIGNYAFSCMYNVTSVSLPDSLVSIGDNAFEQCDALSSVTLPASLGYIGYHAFSENSNLTVTYAGSESAFEDFGQTWYMGLSSATVTFLSYGIETNSDYAHLTADPRFVNKQTAAEGNVTVTVHAQPYNGYTITGLTVTTCSGEQIPAQRVGTGDDFIFVMPEDDVTLDVTYTGSFDGALRLGDNRVALQAFADESYFFTPGEDGWYRFTFDRTLSIFEYAGGAGYYNDCYEGDVFWLYLCAGNDYLIVGNTGGAASGALCVNVAKETVLYDVTSVTSDHGVYWAYTDETRLVTSAPAGAVLYVASLADAGYAADEPQVVCAATGDPICIEDRFGRQNFTMPAESVKVFGSFKVDDSAVRRLTLDASAAPALAIAEYRQMTRSSGNYNVIPATGIELAEGRSYLVRLRVPITHTVSGYYTIVENGETRSYPITDNEFPIESTGTGDVNITVITTPRTITALTVGTYADIDTNGVYAFYSFTAPTNAEYTFDFGTGYVEIDSIWGDFLSYDSSCVLAEGQTCCVILSARDPETLTITQNAVEATFHTVTVTAPNDKNTVVSVHGCWEENSLSFAPPQVDGFVFKMWQICYEDGMMYHDAIILQITFFTDFTITPIFVPDGNTYVFTDDTGVVLQVSVSQNGETPACDAQPIELPENDVQYSYRLAWTPLFTSGEGNVAVMPEAAQFVNEYTVRFYNEDGTLLQQLTVPYGETPVYTGAAPTKAATAQYSFEFNGWSPALAPVTGDATYTAAYDVIGQTYTVQWRNYDGETLETDENVLYGETPEYNGSRPYRWWNDYYVYLFSGWTPQISAVTENVVYTAVFTSIPRDLSLGENPTAPSSFNQYRFTPAQTGWYELVSEYNTWVIYCDDSFVDCDAEDGRILVFLNAGTTYNVEFLYNDVCPEQTTLTITRPTVYPLTVSEQHCTVTVRSRSGDVITSAPEGATVRITTEGETGYYFSTLTAVGDTSGGSVQISYSFTVNDFTMPGEPVTISGTYGLPRNLTLRIDDNVAPYGLILVRPGISSEPMNTINVYPVTPGSEVTLAAIVALPNYVIASVEVNGVEYALDYFNLVFTMPDEDAVITVTTRGAPVKVTFLDDDGVTVLATVETPYGEIPEYPGGDPVKAGYVFNCWTPGLYEITEPTSFTANFMSALTLGENTLRFENGVWENQYPFVPEEGGYYRLTWAPLQADVQIIYMVYHGIGASIYNAVMLRDENGYVYGVVIFVPEGATCYVETHWDEWFGESVEPIVVTALLEGPLTTHTITLNTDANVFASARSEDNRAPAGAAVWLWTESNFVRITSWNVVDAYGNVIETSSGDGADFFIMPDCDVTVTPTLIDPYAIDLVFNGDATYLRGEARSPEWYSYYIYVDDMRAFENDELFLTFNSPIDRAFTVTVTAADGTPVAFESGIYGGNPSIRELVFTMPGQSVTVTIDATTPLTLRQLYEGDNENVTGSVFRFTPDSNGIYGVYSVVDGFYDSLFYAWYDASGRYLDSDTALTAGQTYYLAFCDEFDEALLCIDLESGKELYSITLESDDTIGTVSIPQSACGGSYVYLQILPDAGHKVDQVNFTYVRNGYEYSSWISMYSDGYGSSDLWRFRMPDADVTVTVTYRTIQTLHEGDNDVALGQELDQEDWYYYFTPETDGTYSFYMPVNVATNAAIYLAGEEGYLQGNSEVRQENGAFAFDLTLTGGHTYVLYMYFYDVDLVETTLTITKAGQGLYGDINNDGEVTVSDVTALLNFIAGTGSADAGVCDLNKDGEVTVGDVTALLNHLAGKA